jgi:hypothetical protein
VPDKPTEAMMIPTTTPKMNVFSEFVIYIVCLCVLKKWDRRDSNPQPSDYESPALTIELQSHLIVK